MEQIFIQNFKEKTNKELQHKIDHPEIYSKEAINAAIFILSERSRSEIVVQDNLSENKLFDNDDTGNNDPLGIFKFFRTFNINDILSIITLSLLYLAYIHLLNFISGELIEEKHIIILRYTGFFIFPLFIHIIYKFEKKHSNGYVGRCIMDFLYVLSFIALSTAYDYVIYEKSSFFLDELVIWIIFILLLIIVVLLLELIFNLLKALLNIFRCQIF